MKVVELHGIINLEPLQGTTEWYYSSDYIHGDLYEAQELYRDGHPVSCNCLRLVHYPDGAVYQPVAPVAGQYIGTPIYDAGSIVLLVVYFKEAVIRLLRFSLQQDMEEIVCLPLSAVINCYNLQLCTHPLTLMRQPGDGTIEFIWPEQARFAIGRNESLSFRDGETLYFTEWQENDTDYWEKTIVRAMEDGRILEQFPGDIRIMPNGEWWLVR